MNASDQSMIGAAATAKGEKKVSAETNADMQSVLLGNSTYCTMKVEFVSTAR